MSVFKSKSAYIIILTVEGLATESPFPYIMALILPLIPLDKPIISTILTLISLIPRAVTWHPIALILMLLIIAIHIVLHGFPWRKKLEYRPQSPLSSKYLIFIYLFFFSFLSLASLKLAHHIALLLLYLMLLVYSVHAAATNNLRYIIIFCSIISIIWGTLSYLAKTTDFWMLKRLKNQTIQYWWYFFMLSMSTWIGFILSHQIKVQQEEDFQGSSEQEQNQIKKASQVRAYSSEQQNMIELEDLSGKNARKSEDLQKDQIKLLHQNIMDDNMSEGESSHSSRMNRLPPIPYELIKEGDKQLVKKLLNPDDDQMMAIKRQKIRSAIVKTKVQATKNKKPEKQKKKQQLLINQDRNSRSKAVSHMVGNHTIHHSLRNIPKIRHPHYRSQRVNPSHIDLGETGAGWSEHEGQGQITNLFLLIPFTLFQPTFLQIPIYFYLILLQNGKTPMWVFYIMFISICTITFLQNESSINLQILLRLCMILIVNKNFKLAINITRVLRSIWLRSSFVFVLLVLFWFSLLTVNLFHISFVLIVLLFITRNNNPNSQQPSFRHKNWKYLILLFNIFLILRLGWIISQIDLHLHIPNTLHAILNVMGITYSYNLNIQYFNMIPLIVSGVLTVQYWTYSSRIYDQQSKKTLQFLPTYRTLILKLLEILTIIYYKLIPWTSHLLVLVIIISLQFSLIADLVLVWSLFILLIHMIRPNQLSAYKSMYRMWNIFLRLVSVQIVLRYIFQFIKFPIIFANLSQFPIIKTLIKYQEVLGLAIRESSNSYLKNVFTKFQLMMILDFSIIAISFLAIEYYQIMIKYHEIQEIKEEHILGHFIHKHNSDKKEKQLQENIVRKQSKQSDQHKNKNITQHLISHQNQHQHQPKHQTHSLVPHEFQQQTITNDNAIHIYENYIDFKLTKWLQNFNELMVTFSKLFLKIYYPFLGTYSCIYYSYATMSYFLCCVYYYFKINTKYYQVDVLNQVQVRIMRLFQLWRINNNIRVNLVDVDGSGMARHDLQTERIINNSEIEMVHVDSFQDRQKKDDGGDKQKQKQSQNQIGNINLSPIAQPDAEPNPQKQKPSTKNFLSLVRQLKYQVRVKNQRQIFDNLINLHIRLRYWLLILTMLYIIMNYTSRLLLSSQIQDFMQIQTIEQWRYLLYMCGTSQQSPISINIYLVIVALTVIEIKCCSLVTKIGRPKSLDQLEEKDKEKAKHKRSVSIQDISIDDFQDIVLIEDDKDKEDKIKQKQQKQNQNMLDTKNLKIKDKNRDSDDQFCQQKFRINSINAIQTKDNQKFIDIQISLRLGINKMVQRFFVILLVFVSLLQNQSPFSIIYLICAWFLNYMGSKSIKGLSWTLSFLVIIQYSLLITDTSNQYLGIVTQFPSYVHYSWLIRLFRITDQQWIQYLTFGKNVQQLFVMYLSLVILMLYQVCFYLQQYNWLKVLNKMCERFRIGLIQRKIYEHFSRIYEYALVYSPLCITTLCLGLYLMDFTATNMFLSILSILFLFKSFLLQDYTNSRPFWKSYFRILQLLIVIFMVVYCMLSAPMYQQYCNKILCSPQEMHTKVTKTILLLILQIGIDLISSHHFINAMSTLQNTLNQTSSFYRIAISYVQNDKKIAREFKSLRRKQNIKNSLQEIKIFLNLYQNDQSVRFDNRKIIKTGTEDWLDVIIELLPSLIDAQLIKTPEQTKIFVREENQQFIKWLKNKNKYQLTQDQLRDINQLYVNQFSECKNLTELKDKISSIIDQPKYSQSNKMLESSHSIHPLKRQRKDSYNINMSYDDLLSQGKSNVRKSYIHGIMPFDDQLEILQNVVKKPQLQPQASINPTIQEEQEDHVHGLSRNTKTNRKTVAENLSTVNEEEKKKLLYLLIFQSVLSNWHYLTYSLMVLQFVINMGVLTLPFPILTFTLGIVHSYQAPKTLWRLAFLALLPPIFFKYSLQVQLIQPSATLQFILIGANNTSILVQYFLMFFIIVQCLILKIVGLYDQSTAQVQSMNIALIRNIINIQNENQQQQRNALFTLLQRSKSRSQTFFQYLFSLYECKSGYDYSTMMVTIQLMILVYIFSFYDRMAIRQQLTFYKMIEYNQFTTGMVVMAFIQLAFILLDRILTVLQLSYDKWDITLILKYIILIISLIYVHCMVLVFFPLNSGYFGNNTYILIFYILHIMYFLISALQVKVGVNKQSRGFMDRYTWYNGFIYMSYRAIPFLFEFKVFSDWTFTNTSLRLFDWIKYQEILGYLYVAKCNSLFMRGKILGSKIEWWKKLLMGFPLLLTIILLLFGPLILFSSLNPLASLNQITGGYLQLSLKINKTNQYPFYINTHITDIHFLDKQPDRQLQTIIKVYQLDVKSIQVIHLEAFSDQYWEISEGSYDKLIEEPVGSLYQLTIRVKFDRNQTKTTPVYVLNTYTIPEQRVHQFKQTLKGKETFKIEKFVPAFMRLDNNNGLHFLTEEYFDIQFHAEESKTIHKKYWVINEGITFKMASDKYSKAIFGYSVMSFYISIILVVANYFRSLFQGSAYTIIMSDIPYADPLLDICDGVHQARLRNDIYGEEVLYWTLIDIMRSPDLMKALTGNYLNARIQTLQDRDKDKDKIDQVKQSQKDEEDSQKFDGKEKKFIKKQQ